MMVVLVAANYRNDSIPERSIISGDTAEQAADSGAILVHEATFLESHKDIANEHLHSTAAGAARTAIEWGKHLALTHYSARLDSHMHPF